MDGLISVIVTTYNWEHALDAVLQALARQRDTHFEVVIADDGSGPATAALLEGWRDRAPFSLMHAYQEDRGFRAAQARNRAVLASRGTYCVFLDGDCIPRCDFVAAHRRLAEPGWFVSGNRSLMSRTLSEQVLRETLDASTWRAGELLRLYRSGDINRAAPLLALRLGPLRKLQPRRWRGVRSCNLAIWRADLDRVDGFDATFDGWGREDSDLVLRLIRAGARRKDGRLATGVLHLWHAESDRSRLAENNRLLNEVVTSDRIRARQGLSTIIASNGIGCSR